MLQRAAAHCSKLQHTATHYSTLQNHDAAAHSNSNLRVLYLNSTVNCRLKNLRKAWVTFRQSSAKLHLPCSNTMFQSCVDCFNSIGVTSSNTAPWVIGNRLSRHTESIALNASHWMHHIQSITLRASHWKHHTVQAGYVTLNSSHWMHYAECITTRMHIFSSFPEACRRSRQW